MKITNHRMVNDDGSSYRFVATPNMGGQLVTRYLVMHYPAGSSAESSIQSLCSKAAKASAHVVIGHDGSVAQLVPFN
jgi:N-acetylmuramoyl-L-alanine amidase